MIDRRRLLMLLLPVALATPAAGARAAGASKEDEAAAGQDPYVRVPTLMATVMGPGGRRGVMTVQSTLYVPTMPQRIKASKSLPYLMNAFVPVLQGFASNLPPGAVPNIEVLSRSLQAQADRVLGKGSKVLIGGVLVT